MPTKLKPGRFARLLLPYDAEAIATATGTPLSTVYSWRNGALPASSRLETIAGALKRDLLDVQEAWTADKARRLSARRRGKPLPA